MLALVLCGTAECLRFSGVLLIQISSGAPETEVDGCWRRRAGLGHGDHEGRDSDWERHCPGRGILRTSVVLDNDCQERAEEREGVGKGEDLHQQVLFRS
jgi:hypothetical protein